MYKSISVTELCNCLAAHDVGSISLNAVRVYFSAFELTSIREAARRSKKPARRTKEAVVPIYRIREFERLTGLTAQKIRRALKELDRSDLLTFDESTISPRASALEVARPLIEAARGGRSPRRPIPFPRRMLRFIARCSKPALLKTIVAHSLRGLAIDRAGGRIRSAGSAKCSWIAEAFSISLRSVKSARKTLILLGWLTPDTGSTQRKLNRTGSYFTIVLEWGRQNGGSHPTRANGARQGAGAGTERARDIAPPCAKNCTAFAPPREDKKTPNGSNTQKTRSAASNTPGVCRTTSGGPGRPSLWDVKLGDLEDFSRTEQLYHQAVARKLVGNSEADLLDWVAAAVRAKTCGARDPVRVFLGIVRGKLWSNISQADEDRARAAIRKHHIDREPVDAVKAVLKMIA